MVSPHRFSVAPGKYFLRDAGYWNAGVSPGTISGYQVPPKKQKLTVEKYAPLYSLCTTLMIYKPQTPMELFNLRHAFLRDIVKRIFEILRGDSESYGARLSTQCDLR